MKTSLIKTIDVQAKEWFDKVNGNSYFSMDITINFGKNNQKTIYVPMQYGYGDHYRFIAFKTIKKELNCFKTIKENDGYWNAYDKYKIISRHSKKTNCLKREL
jgi:hypothetical protein